MEIKEGYKQTEVGIVPEDWSVKPVSSMCDFIVPGRNKPRIFDGNIPWITTPDIQGNHVRTSRNNLFITGEEAKNIGSKIVPKGSVIISCVGELGLVTIADNELVINQQLHAFLPFDIVNQYLLYALKRQKNYMYSVATKTALPYLNKNNCNFIPIPLPPTKAEQTAIATVLSDTDALISRLETLIEKKRAVKQGAMQQLLKPKEGWVEKKLEEIGECLIGLTYSPNDVKETGLLVLRSSNVQNNILSYEDNVFVNISVPEKLIVKENDILICVRNGSRDLIGKCALIKGRAVGETFGAFMSVFRSPYNLFLFGLFQSDIIKRQINEHLGATINQITNKSLNSFEVPFPPEEEQARIAQILSEMDAEIAGLEQKLAKYKLVKQGMMQELLTGKTRLV